MIYLDNNATTAIDTRVAEGMFKAWQQGPLNASSQHAAGRLARVILDDAISRLGSVLGADVDSPGGDALVITSGGTESNHLALFGIGDPAGPLVISAIEHPSILEPARAMAAAGREVRVIPVLKDGTIDLQAADRLIAETSPTPALVSVMSANNETGVIQPIAGLATICARHGVPLHSDATQTIGKVPFDFAASGIAAVTATPHKFHGPCGVGLLLVRSGVTIRPIFRGGQQQLERRAGTEPVPLVVGMAIALELAMSELADSAVRVAGCRDRLEGELRGEFAELVIHGEGAPRLPGTTFISFPGADRQAMLMALDMGGVACSSGSACASGSSRPSHVLAAMGVAGGLIDSALRFGFTRFSTADETERAIGLIRRQYRRLSGRSKHEMSRVSLDGGLAST